MRERVAPMTARLLPLVIYLGLAAVGPYPALFAICSRCREDDAYRGFLVYAPALLVVTTAILLAWFASRAMPVGGAVGFAFATGIGVAALTLAAGATRVLIPPVLDLFYFGLLFLGVAAVLRR